MLVDLARLFLGALMFYSGLNGFFHFRPLPQQDRRLVQFVQALERMGFVMELVKFLEVVTGALLLLGIFVPLSLAILAPIIIVIVGAQLSLNFPSGLWICLQLVIPYALLLVDQNFLH